MSQASLMSTTAVHRTMVDEISAFVCNPLGFVYWAFPWGEKGTLLEEDEGPELWQIDILVTLGKACEALRGSPKGREKAVRDAIKIAVASGHGIGKTALICWIILWFLSTRRAPAVVLTANTKTQLQTKTWRELTKWKALCRCGDWFEKTATKMYAKWAPENWFAAAIPWTKTRAEAFAGTHELHVLVLFDEGSAIDDLIWETVEGAMTYGECIWIAFGNPTRNTGRFRECFRRYRDEWITRQVDSRTSTLRSLNRAVLDRWVKTYGEDSDFVRIRVKGQFPRQGSNQLIAEDLVEMARTRVPTHFEHMPIIVGVDPARYGASQTVIYVRQGTATREVHKYRELNPMTLIGILTRLIERVGPEQMFMDIAGMGAVVWDRLDQMGYGDKVLGVNPGEASTKKNLKNRRIEMWADMREWLRNGGAIDENDQELYEDLIGPEYFFDRANKMMLETKEDMLGRNLPSPDTGDALALTFYTTVSTPDLDDLASLHLPQKRRSFMSS